MKTETCREEGPFNDRGRDWSDTATSQGIPRIVGQHQKLRNRGRILLSGIQREHGPADASKIMRQ